MNVSSKTVRNYLEEIEIYLNKKNIKLIKKPSLGIYLEITSKERDLLKQETSLVIADGYSSKYRQKYILKILFKNRYAYTIQIFADELYCSKNTIISDLNYVENWLHSHNLSLIRKQNQGLWIEGDEAIFRNAMSSFFHELTEGQHLNPSIKNEQLDYRLDTINLNKIKTFFPKFDLNLIQSIIQESEIQLGYSFTDQSFVNLIIHIAIALERMKFEKNIIVDEKEFKNIKKTNEYSCAKFLVNNLEKYLKITIPEEEIIYICLHILGAKVQHDIDFDNYDVATDLEEKEYEDVAKKIIALVSDVLMVDLKEDRVLLTSLILHLKPTIVRLKNNLRLENPILSKIKEEYLSIFGAAWSCESILNQHFNVYINEDEIGYITLHIASAIERLNNKINVVIVCSSGIATSQLVANRLKKRIPELEITNILPVKYLTEEIIKNNEIIISTITLSKDIKKVVHVSSFINEHDILQIRNYINQNKIYLSRINEANNLVNKNTINNIISTKYSFIETENLSYENILKKYSDILEKDGIIKKGFFENLLERETKSSTVIGNGIAIPHAKERFVIKPKVCIIKLEKPINWKNERVELIFILALKFSDIQTIKKFFKNFYTILDDNILIDKIKKLDSSDEVAYMFINS